MSDQQPSHHPRLRPPLRPPSDETGVVVGELVEVRDAILPVMIGSLPVTSVAGSRCPCSSSTSSPIRNCSASKRAPAQSTPICSPISLACSTVNRGPGSSCLPCLTRGPAAPASVGAPRSGWPLAADSAASLAVGRSPLSRPWARRQSGGSRWPASECPDVGRLRKAGAGAPLARVSICSSAPLSGALAVVRPPDPGGPRRSRGSAPAGSERRPAPARARARRRCG